MAIQEVARNKVLYASAARTATPNTAAQATQHNRQHKGVLVIVNISAVPGSAPSIVPSIVAVDPISGNTVQLHANFSALTGTGTSAYILHPSAVAGWVAGGLTAIAASQLPESWAVVMTHGNANSATYSVSAVLLP